MPWSGAFWRRVSIVAEPGLRAMSAALASAPRRQRLLAWIGALLLVLMLTGGWMLIRWEPLLLPVRLIAVEGELHHHSSRLLQQTLTERLDGGILTANLLDLKAAAEELPWVGRVRLRRVWPDQLVVEVEEHRPIARWNADGLVTAGGVVFRPRTGTLPAGLPRLVGEDARAPELARRYLQWRDELMLIGQLIETLELDARGDWRISLIMGTELRLGTTAIEERLARFIANAPQLERVGLPRVIDLRYSNGFAVQWESEPAVPLRATPDRTARSGHRG